MLMGRNVHFTKVYHATAAPANVFAGSSFSSSSRTDEIFMLIVAKLPTKENKNAVTRSCQAAPSK